MDKIDLPNGSLILVSKEGRALANALTEQGVFWEYLSGLIEERAKFSLNRDEVTRNWTDGEIQEVLSLLKEIKVKLDSLDNTGGVGQIMPVSPPSFGDSEVNKENKSSVTKVKVDQNVINKDIGSVLSKFRQMGREK